MPQSPSPVYVIEWTVADGNVLYGLVIDEIDTEASLNRLADQIHKALAVAYPAHYVLVGRENVEGAVEELKVTIAKGDHDMLPSDQFLEEIRDVADNVWADQDWVVFKPE